MRMRLFGDATFTMYGRVHVDRHGRLLQLGGVVARRRLLPPLRVAEEDLDAVGVLGHRGAEGVVGFDMASDSHAAEPTGV